ncbi:hypothetical protein E2C01_049895 [Portunus trituberculatus]|uniref:Uncharacterized protein n=1 Tax=Portunus trituberculatus TaxID=210409 RepID=A0A5B7GF01_PORTR|nr:hypothetical protein [Portunus trituberculatus]
MSSRKRRASLNGAGVYEGVKRVFTVNYDEPDVAREAEGEGRLCGERWRGRRPREPVPGRRGQRGGPASPRHPNPPLQSPSARSSRTVVKGVTYVGFVLNSIGLLSERLQFHYHSRRGG